MALESVFVPKDFCNSQSWRMILKEWISIIHDYCFSFDDKQDVPYWYGERALTGLISGAAWRIKKGWALEEFSTKRGKKENGQSGRGDLWVGIGSNTFTIEAKITWPEGDLETAKNRVYTRLNEAANQLRDIEESCCKGDPISVCYVVPWPKINEQVQDQSVYGKILCDLVSYYQSEGAATALFIPDGAPHIIEDGRIYPGVALIARSEKWLHIK